MSRSRLTLDSLPETLQAWCQHLGLPIEARYAPSGDEDLFPNRLLIEGPGAEALAAQRGLGLDALQFLVHEGQGHPEDGKLAYLDAQGTRLFRMKEVVAMAKLAAEKARQMGNHTMGALSPRERRWVHITLERDGDLGSESEGVGNFKQVRVFKKG